MAKEKIDKKFDLEWVDFGLIIFLSIMFCAATYVYWYDMVPSKIMWCITSALFPLYVIGFTCVAKINNIMVELSKKKEEA